MPPCNGLKVEEASIDQLQTWMSQGKLTSTQLALCYQQRIYQTQFYIKYVIQACGSSPGVKESTRAPHAAVASVPHV